MRDENKNLKNELSSVKQLIDNNEGKGRNNCLVIHGTPESEDDNTDEPNLTILNEDVNVGISLDNIDRSHRLGSKKTVNTKPKPIIITFPSMRKGWMSFVIRKIYKEKRLPLPKVLLQ